MGKISFIGLDVHKASISVSVAEEGRDGAVTFVGSFPNTPVALTKLAKKLSKEKRQLEFCYEAGCCGYTIYRHLVELGHGCTVVATSLIPRKPGERIKTDRRDSEKLAILHRSGNLTAVWVPDENHESMRDLTRARVDASMQLMRARQQLLAFLLRHGRTYETGKHWTQRHRAWLAGQTFDQAAHQMSSMIILKRYGRLRNAVSNSSGALAPWPRTGRWDRSSKRCGLCVVLTSYPPRRSWPPSGTSAALKPPGN